MVKEIIGREQEQEDLGRLYDSDKSELIAVYGRRRIGKTFLIRNFYDDKIVFDISGMDGAKTPQLIKRFYTELLKKYHPFGQMRKPKDWLDLFEWLKIYLDTLTQDEKKVIFIDEFPWFDTGRSGFLPVFESFWNDYCTKRDDLVVVVCGSTASYMVKNIINNTGGLHNRISKRLKIEPFNLNETKKFLASKGIKFVQYDILKIYMVLGGIPLYLEQVQKGDSIVTLINRICFEKGAILQDEYKVVFKSLFGKSKLHENVIHKLANAEKKGLTRSNLLNLLGIDSGGPFTDALEDLIMSGFIEKYNHHSGKSQELLYRIIDEFCLFHIKFMKSHKGNSWEQLHKTKDYETWCGTAFELICLKHTNHIKKGLGRKDVISDNYGWRNTKAQIDLVIDRADNVVNLCELKYYKDVYNFNNKDFLDLTRRADEFATTTNTQKNIHTVMITTHGITENQHSDKVVTKSLTMDCLFEKL